MRFHWQNLSNEDEHGRGRGIPFEGRCWWRIGREDRERWHLQFSWHLKPRDSAGVSVGVDEEDGIVFHVGLWLISLWFSIGFPGSHKIQRSREIRLAFHGGIIWWSLWKDPMGGWDSRTPKWRDGNIHVVDLLLGKPQYSCRELCTERVPIPLPEGVTMATATLGEASWTRARWFTKRRRSVDFKPDKPSPVPGKGENSWDCGPDAIYGGSYAARTIAEGIGRYVGSVLETRRKRGAAWGYAEADAPSGPATSLEGNLC